MRKFCSYCFLMMLCIGLLFFKASAQRLSDVNTVGWYNAFGTFYLHKKTSIWMEYQWRRENVITNWQQSLPRIGLQHHFKNGMSALLGYAYVTTYPYGDYPAGPHAIPEQRIFEQLIWNDAIGRVNINHRLRLEQRFVGKIDQKGSTRDIDSWTYLNRVRYQMKLAIPINYKTLQDKTWYASTFDELFIGFGKNVNQNVFDQNRIGLLLGYQFNKTFKAEGGYFNQTVQQGTLVAGKQVYQYNHGIMLNMFITR